MARTTLLIATRNKGKVREFAQLFGDLPGLSVVAMTDLPHLPEVIEDGETFEANACKKAREIAAASGELVLADDSGLEVDALGGRPGVYSARYAGAHGEDEANNDKLLGELSHVPDAQRTARYRVVLAFADPQGPLGARVHTEHGTCEGRILHARRGTGGFGYDPLFLPQGFTLSMAELPADDKHRISHRGVASRKMQAFLAAYLRDRSAR
jgi:XTP/dITP diphosphohydrolase